MSKNDYKRILREHKVFCVESKKKNKSVENNAPAEGEKKSKQKKTHPSKMKYKKEA